MHVRQLELGTLICAQCNRILDTFDTEKVTVYYGVCPEPNDCRSRDNHAESNRREDFER